MNRDPIWNKLGRVRNLPLLTLRVLQGQKPDRLYSTLGHQTSLEVVRNVQDRHHFRTFIETGTFEGQMVAAVKDLFETVYSIELDKALYEKACARFQGDKHVHIKQGNSGEVLPAVLREISSPALFWLDAHYSAGVTARGRLFSPILEELGHILAHPVPGHIILIDDYWEFGTMKDYPSMGELRDYLSTRTRTSNITVKNGVIQVTYEALVGTPQTAGANPA